MSIRASTLVFVFLAVASRHPLSAQNNNGVWESPFNHVIPTVAPMDWQEGGAQWDGEPQGTIRRFMAGHMALIPVGPCRGKVLVWNWMRVPLMPGGLAGIQHWAIIDVSGTPTFQNFDLPIPAQDGDLFCSGHAWTKDGDLFVAGGDNYFNNPTTIDPDPNKLAYRFDPDFSATPDNSWWRREPDLSVARWYPTVTALSTDANGKDVLLVVGGDTADARNTYEAFDSSGSPGSGTWQVVPLSTPGDRVFDGPTGPWPTSTPNTTCFHNKLLVYSRAFLLTSGKVFFAGMSGLPYRLDHTGRMNAGQPPIWEIPTTSNNLHREYSSAFLYPNLGGPNGGNQDIVVRVGGHERTYGVGGDPCALAADNGESSVTEFCSAAAADPVWNGSWPSMNHPRLFPNTVLLPDGSALAFSASHPNGGGSFVLEAEVFNDDPGTPNSWRPVASAAVYRGYHSTGVLLPDGRVLVGGGEQRQQWNGVSISGPADYEVFDPHYITNGTQRPQILTAPATLSYGSSYTASYAAMSGGVTVERAVLMAPGSVTHHSDMHQRYVELKRVFLQQFPPPPNPTITFKAPASSANAPRGYYMLFLVTGVQAGANRRAPSIATWVKLQ